MWLKIPIGTWKIETRVSGGLPIIAGSGDNVISPKKDKPTTVKASKDW